MARLEDLKNGISVRGVVPNDLVTVLDVRPYGSEAVELTYRDSTGQPGNILVYRDQAEEFELVERGKPWSFDADPELFKLVSEAYRIRMGYLFDPLLAVTTSLVEPLPHQITGVYGEMLPRQPLRFLLADDPGAGKTIMAGLLIKELIARGDLHRCLVCCPGNLVTQWQDEMWQKFHLDFTIISRETIENSKTGNPYSEHSLVISRLDQMARSDETQEKLRYTEWDVVVCDEAHKMSASVYGAEIKRTKRYRLGQLLSGVTRHFLLLTATPHNGKEEDFQLFMALIDPDRFEGRYREGVHTSDVSDLMRRMVKEGLLKFEGTPLFPERRAYTVSYELSSLERQLYDAVTAYVREEFNRVERLENEGRKGTVGFALTTLQRRLASSPEAIWRSLSRRRERLEKRLDEERLAQRGDTAPVGWERTITALTEEDIEDLEDAPDSELEEFEDAVIDEATAAKTVAELKAEIETLIQLEALAEKVKNSRTDKKWEELSKLLQEHREMFDGQRHRRKLVIFSEHRDTIRYLTDRIRTVLGRPEAVAVIHGGMGREDRRNAQEAFTQDKNALILVATDAAGEGINLQRAHLMVNYDLPWNPNRLEQRFGRIHRIGQTEVCHLWNLVAADTREGDVFERLLTKLEAERQALGGRAAVFDVLGGVFSGRELRGLLIEAIRYGERPDVKARLFEKVDMALDREHLRELLEERALARDTMDATRVQEIREQMERAEARKLQPHYISAFFIEAFKRLGGTIRERETDRWEITHVPSPIRNRSPRGATPIQQRYERITFKKELIAVSGKPLAAFVCPGHPLLDATTDMILAHHRDLLKRGTVLVDPEDTSDTPRVLCYLEHSIQDAGRTGGAPAVVSRHMNFVELDDKGAVRTAGAAPHLNYEPLNESDRSLIKGVHQGNWLSEDLEGRARDYAIRELVPAHVRDVKERRDELVTKTMAAVKDRLTKEIAYWDRRAEELKAQEAACKQPRMNWQRARERATELEDRLTQRLDELVRERKLSPLPPVVIGGALVVPVGLLRRRRGESIADSDQASREQVERLAMEAILGAERALGYEPRDVSAEKCGYDIESRDPKTGHLRFVEVKGRSADADTVTVTRNEITVGLNSGDRYLLAIVKVDGDKVDEPRYVRRPFQRDLDFGVTSVNYSLSELLARSTTAS